MKQHNTNQVCILKERVGQLSINWVTIKSFCGDCNINSEQGINNNKRKLWSTAEMLPWRWLLLQYCEGRQTWMHHYNPKGKNKALNTGTSIHRNPKNSKPNALHKTSFDSVLGVVTVIHTLCDTTWKLNWLWIPVSYTHLDVYKRQ